MTFFEQLESKIAQREARVAVVGLGYVGLPLLIAFGEAGFPVLGLDIDASKTERIARGESYFRHIPSGPLAALRAAGRLEASTDYARAAEADAILICVPTPLNPHREPDLSYIVKTAEALRPHLRAGQLLVLESTTFPGTTDSVLRGLLEGAAFRLDEAFWLAFSPEREDPGNQHFTLGAIPKVVGGVTEQSTLLADALYSAVAVQTVRVSDAATAEAVKLTENVFRAVNIALVNELKVIYQRMGIDVWEVIAAAATKPFGFMPFYPGPGLGGHCIPIDPFYLAWRAKEFGQSTRFIELAGEINRDMPHYVISRLGDALNDQAKCFRGARILIIGMAYKPDVDDTRESPSLALYALLQARGAVVDYYDPYVPVIPKTREHGALAGIESITWDEDALAGYDAVLISTAHSGIDYGALVRRAKLVVDTRNATAAVQGPKPHVYKA